VYKPSGQRLYNRVGPLNGYRDVSKTGFHSDRNVFVHTYTGMATTRCLVFAYELLCVISGFADFRLLASRSAMGHLSGETLAEPHCAVFDQPALWYVYV